MIIGSKVRGRRWMAVWAGIAAVGVAGSGVAAVAAPQRWTDMRLPALAPGVKITAVKAFGAEDVWVFAAKDTRSGIKPAAKPKAFHWNGAKWRRFTLPWRGQVLEVQGRPRDFWVTVDGAGSASGWNGVLRRKKGRWVGAKRLPRPHDGSHPHTGLTVLARDDVRVFTRRTSQGPTIAWRYNGRKWKSKRFGRFLTTFEVLPGGGMWAADTTGGEDESALYRYAGGRWKRQAVPSSLGCRDEYCGRFIWFVEKTSKGLVVGYGDRLLRRNGTRWSLLAQGPVGGPVSDGADGFWSVETDEEDLSWDGVVHVAPTGRLTTIPYKGPAKGISLWGLAVSAKGPVFAYGTAKSPTGRRSHLWRVNR